MKYIVELEDEPCMRENGVNYYICKSAPWHNLGETVINRLTPYTEPDRKAIEDEVWEFATTCTKMDGADSVDVFGGFSLDSFTKYSYQEAKSKYDAWKKQKDEIHVGDEVKFGSRSGVVVRIDTEPKDSGVNVVCREGNTAYIGMADVTKTGRHFDEVEKLLERMKAE